MLYVLNTWLIFAITFCKQKGPCLPTHFLPHQILWQHRAKELLIYKDFRIHTNWECILSLSWIRCVSYHFPTFLMEKYVTFYIILSCGTVQNLGFYLSEVLLLVYHYFLLCMCPVVFFFPLISVSWSPDREWNIRFVKRISLFKCLEMMG